MDNNAYLLRCASTGQGILVDAANEAGRLIELIGDTPVGTIVTTHRHADHWQALPEVQARTGAVVVAHPADADELPVQVGHRAEHGEVLTFGDCAVSLIWSAPNSIWPSLTVAPSGTSAATWAAIASSAARAAGGGYSGGGRETGTSTSMSSGRMRTSEATLGTWSFTSAMTSRAPATSGVR